jgi:competence protein ComEC
MKFEHLFWYLCLSAGFLLSIYADQFWKSSDLLKVSFLDIGQGDSIFIETPHGRTILIDGGPGTTVLEKLGEVTSFWMKTIDLVILTHPDLDHLEGLLEVLPRYRVEKILLTGVVHDTQLYRSFLEMIEEYDIETYLPSPDQDWQIDEQVFLDIIAPSRDVSFQEVEKPNDTSIVAKLIYRYTTLLLTGDGEELEEHEMLLSDSDLRSEFLKSGHHGSRTSGSLDFLRAVQAKEAAIISGRENPFDHPHLETVLRYDERGMEWWNTKDEGTMTFVSDGVVWERERPPNPL